MTDSDRVLVRVKCPPQGDIYRLAEGRHVYVTGQVFETTVSRARSLPEVEIVVVLAPAVDDDLISPATKRLRRPAYYDQRLRRRDTVTHTR